MHDMYRFLDQWLQNDCERSRPALSMVAEKDRTGTARRTRRFWPQVRFRGNTKSSVEDVSTIRHASKFSSWIESNED
ncbi:hypothetical protein RRF57_007400 [Xylaria bambusicola]|uniref:Uncharacterized protein n=1 Tax=Xylaria bambusicola TaxID=326684 RepID=A0AAN7ZAE2_9PEZI